MLARAESFEHGGSTGFHDGEAPPREKEAGHSPERRVGGSEKYPHRRSGATGEQGGSLSDGAHDLSLTIGGEAHAVRRESRGGRPQRGNDERLRQ
jgi:hypothetical protein